MVKFTNFEYILDKSRWQICYSFYDTRKIKNLISFKIIHFCVLFSILEWIENKIRKLKKFFFYIIIVSFLLNKVTLMNKNLFFYISCIFLSHHE